MYRDLRDSRRVTVNGVSCFSCIPADDAALRLTIPTGTSYGDAVDAKSEQNGPAKETGCIHDNRIN